MEQATVQRATNARSPAPKRLVISKQLRNDLRAYVFIAPWLIGILVFIAYPVLASFFFAMTRYNIITAPKWIGMANFEEMFTGDPLFWKAVSNTVYFTVISVPLSLATALALALLLNRRARGIGLYRTAFYLPSLVPIVATTLIWMMLLTPRTGLLNLAISALGLPSPGWFMSADWSKPALIIMTLWAGTGAAMLIFLAGLKDIPPALLEAATIDGANSWQRLTRVTIPLLTPTIFFNLILGVIAAFQVFGSVFVATSSGQGFSAAGPLNSLLMYMILLYRNAFRFFNMGYAAAMAIAMFILLMIITMLLVRSSSLWVHYEGDRR
jgi:multiple sugar transport system permease protein